MKKIIFLLLTAYCPLSFAQNQTNVESTLETIDVSSGKRTVILQESRHFEAPNWSRDGKYFIVNSSGLLEKISFKGEKLGNINTDFANKCNNDHGISFDGKTLYISHNDTRMPSTGGNSRVFTLPIEGGTPKLLTEKAPSYWHGISPDGQMVVFCAARNGNYDVYATTPEGSEEKRLTTAEGLDDGPEFSPDGKYIYFNSYRTGIMQIWRMKPDGSEQEQVIKDEFADWFAHPSPDGKWIVYISYMEDQKGAHPFGKDVRLRLMNLKTKEIKDLTPVFFGGQGTINVPSWSPDSKQIAFVHYRILK